MDIGLNYRSPALVIRYKRIEAPYLRHVFTNFEGHFAEPCDWKLFYSSFPSK